MEKRRSLCQECKQYFRICGLSTDGNALYTQDCMVKSGIFRLLRGSASMRNAADVPMVVECTHFESFEKIQ